MTEHDRPSERQPMFNLPPATMALLVTNVLVHAGRSLLSPALDDRLVDLLALVPARYSTSGGLGWPEMVDPITYQFIHGSLTHLALNMLALLAFGAGVERWLGGARLIIFFLVCGIAGAAAQIVATPHAAVAVIGASGAISGLFGGVLRLQRRVGAGAGFRLWPIAAIWIAVIVVTGQTGLPGTGGMPVAWVVHLGGFIAGLLLFGFFERPAVPPRL